MSGVEVVGLLLGAFPLIISAAEDYKRGFAPLKKWKRFRAEFTNFIDAVHIEKLRFDMMLERFLISCDIPQEELQLFMTRPDYKGWQREDIVLALKTRLGQSFEVYMSTLKTMNSLMDDLHTLLSLKDGSVDWANNNANWWDFQLKRIRLSFRDEGQTILSSLEVNNRRLRDLLDSHDNLNSMKETKTDMTWAKVFENIRCHARSLHTALKRGWNCTCVSPHVAALRLQQRPKDNWSPDFNVVFSAPSEIKTPVKVRREVVITIREKIEPAKSAPEQVAGPFMPKGDYLNEIRRDFQSKSSLIVNNIPHPTVPHSISASPPASPSAVNIISRPPFPHSVSTSSSSSSYTGFKSYFTKSDSGKGTPASSMTSISNGSAVLIGDAQFNNRRFAGKPKKKKFARFDMPMELLIHPPVQCITIPAVKELPSPTSQASTTTTIDVEIQDLCSKMANPALSACFGYLRGEEERLHELRAISENPETPAQGNESLVSLEGLLEGREGLRLSRLERFKVASVLASSLLQLQTTPWLIQKMEKKNILFYRRGSKILIEHPYLSHPFLSSKAPQASAQPNDQATSDRMAVKNSLSNLGILLLELGFWQTIESYYMREDHFGADGKPHQFTNYLTALAWSDKVSEEEPSLEKIIECCLKCIFPVKADWNDKKFIQAVYASVVGPLENIIKKWPAT